MAIIAEYREFFNRHTQVNSGAKKDQETGYILRYLVDDVLKYNRFEKGDYPSEGIFEKLFQSICFKLNPEDKATATTQGLVSLATAAEVQAGTPDIDAAGFALVTQPSQMPIITAADASVTVTPTPVANHIQYAIKSNAVAPTITNGAWTVITVTAAGVPAVNEYGSAWAGNSASEDIRYRILTIGSITIVEIRGLIKRINSNLTNPFRISLAAAPDVGMDINVKVPGQVALQRFKLDSTGIFLFSYSL